MYLLLRRIKYSVFDSFDAPQDRTFVSQRGRDSYAIDAVAVHIRSVLGALCTYIASYFFKVSHDPPEPSS
jgi:hypothetical protein